LLLQRDRVEGRAQLFALRGKQPEEKKGNWLKIRFLLSGKKKRKEEGMGAYMLEKEDRRRFSAPKGGRKRLTASSISRRKRERGP